MKSLSNGIIGPINDEDRLRVARERSDLVTAIRDSGDLAPLEDAVRSLNVAVNFNRSKIRVV
jgi:hypothetical protein